MKLLSIAPGLAIASIAAVEAAAVALDFNTIIMALIGLGGAWVSMKVATLAAQAKDAKVVADKTSETMNLIHTAVNSKETITAKRIDEQNALILDLSKTIKTLEEKLRGQDTAKQVAEAARPVVLQAAPVPPTVQV